MHESGIHDQYQWSFKEQTAPLVRQFQSMLSIKRLVALFPRRQIRCQRRHGRSVASTAHLVTREVIDCVPLERVRQLNATIFAESKYAPDSTSDGDPLPPLYHWLGFQVQCPISETGRDGHPRRGHPVYDQTNPGVPDSWRRMFGGSEIEFHNRRLTIGSQMLRRSKLIDVIDKQGKTPLKLCKVKYDYLCQENEPAITETQTIVYIAPPPEGENKSKGPPKQSASIPDDAKLIREFSFTPTILFRYSALTFNGHRIHYDVDYCREVEGYDSLVVHGPMLATLLAHAAMQVSPPTSVLRKWTWRALSPVLVTDVVEFYGVVGSDVHRLYALNKSTGSIAVEATAEIYL